MKKNFLKIVICVASFSCLSTADAMRKVSRQTEYKLEYAFVKQCEKTGWSTVYDCCSFCGCIDFFLRSKPDEKKLIQRSVQNAYNVTKNNFQGNDDFLLACLYLGSLGYPETPARKKFNQLKKDFLIERNIGASDEELFIAKHAWNIQKLAMQELFQKYGKVENKCAGNLSPTLLTQCFFTAKKISDSLKREMLQVFKENNFIDPLWLRGE